MKEKTAAAKHRLTKEERMFHLMLLPGLIVLLIFVFVPLIGSLMAFQDYVPAKGLFASNGSDWRTMNSSSAFRTGGRYS